MKRVLLGSLSAFALLLAVAPVGKAATQQTSPVDVVNLARNGYFRDRGIPSYARLVQEVAAGQIAAEDIIRAAVQDKRVSPEALTDKRFLNVVEAELHRITLPVE
jgi:hypothetical protein